MEQTLNIRPWPEVQEILPPLSLTERRALTRSIRQDGVKQPILVLPDGTIIDGHHRWEVGLEVGQDVPYQIEDVPLGQAFALALALNWARRQMTESQWAEIRKRVEKDEDLQKELTRQLRDRGMTQAETAVSLGIAQQTVSAWEGLIDENEENITNTGDGNSYTPPDWRVKIPKEHHYIIHDRFHNGETQREIAADYKTTQPAISRIIRKVDREIEKAQAEEQARQDRPKPEGIKLFCADIAEIAESDIAPGSIDIIITDPPYPHEFIPLYGILAQQATWLVKPGGLILAMAGQSWLPEVMEQMNRHLTYHWILAYLTPGGQSPQIWPRKVNTFWKPVLVFVNGEFNGDDWHGDVIKSDVNDNDKRFHEWGQSESGMARLVEAFSKEGDLVLDPFLGGGTTAVVCTSLNRHFIGSDIDPDKVKTAQRRLGLA